MNNKYYIIKKITLFFIFLLLVAQFFSLVFAADVSDISDISTIDDGDWMLLGVEGEKLFNFGSGLVALLLLGLTLSAYHRNKNKRLLYVSLAFLLFAVKGFFTSHELFFSEWEFADPVAAVLNFAIMMAFFAGILKK